MYRFFLILLLGSVFSTSAMASVLTFDGERGRASFFATHAPDGSVTHLTIRGQDIDSPFVEKLGSFLRVQQSIKVLIFNACEFSTNNFHFLTNLGELENFAMTNCAVDSEMARVVLANLNGYTVTSIDFSGNPSLDSASKSVLTGKFGGNIIWDDDSKAFDLRADHPEADHFDVASGTSTPRRGEADTSYDYSPPTAAATPARHPGTVASTPARAHHPGTAAATPAHRVGTPPAGYGGAGDTPVKNSFAGSAYNHDALPLPPAPLRF